MRLVRKGAIGNHFVPVLCGSAFKNKGVQPLLDAVCAYLPSPLDVPPMKVSQQRRHSYCVNTSMLCANFESCSKTMHVLIVIRSCVCEYTS